MKDSDTHNDQVNPKPSIENLTEGSLIKLFQGWTQLHSASNQVYYEAIKKRRGEQVAFECYLKAHHQTSSLDVPVFNKATSAYLEHPSKEMLILLMRAYAKLYAQQNRNWYNAIWEKTDEMVALECEVEAWCSIA